MLTAIAFATTLGSADLHYVPAGFRPLVLSKSGVHYGNDDGIPAIGQYEAGSNVFNGWYSITTSRCGVLVINTSDSVYGLWGHRHGGFSKSHPQVFGFANVLPAVFARDGAVSMSTRQLYVVGGQRSHHSLPTPFEAKEIRFAYTSSITRLAVVVHRPSQLWTDVWTNSNGSWQRIDTVSQNFLFCPTSVTEGGTIVGSVYKTTDVEQDPLAEGLAQGMEYQSRVPLRPALWKEGRWTFPALPTSISKKHSFNVRLLMNWQGKNLAEIDEWNPQSRFDTFPLRYMIEHKNKYTDLTPALTPHFIHPKLLDYDITSGRILFVENDPKTELDHRKYLIYQM